MSWVAIDFETANSARDSACALGMAVVEDGRVAKTTSWLIRPPVLDFDPFNVSIHGITSEDVKDSPTFGELWRDVGPLLAGKCLIAHNASFDMSVLRHSLDVYGIPYPAVDYYCTCNFCRAVWPGQIAYKLDMVAEMLGIQFQHHDAGADATACAMVSLECCKRAGTDDLAVLAKQHMISRGRLYPGGYEPCSGRRLFRGSAHRHREVSEPLPTGDENDGPLVTITGTLKSMTRYEAAKLVVDHGWRFKDTLTRSTSFLVVGEQDYQHFKSGTKSMKLLHAEDLLRSGHPIEIITEDDLLRMLGD